MTLLSDWSNYCVDLACKPQPYFWSGARKILSNQSVTFKMDNSMSIETAGYTKYKMTRLHDQYYVKEAWDVALMLHARNIERKKYASAAAHCYGHLLKAEVGKTSKRASIMGPCLQSVVLTLLPHEKRTAVSVFYRTTEICKKFPADLIWLRDNVLVHVPGQDRFPIVGVNFHFVGLTVHPMYFCTVLPYLPDPIGTLQLLKAKDRAMWEWVGKWTVRYLIGGVAGRSIEKFAQAQRTADAAVELLKGDVGNRVVRYLCDNRKDFMPSRTNFEGLNEAFDAALERVT